MSNNQLEFGLVPQTSSPVALNGCRRVSRAAWWFAQMRRVVDSAMDWSAETPARPQQIPLPGTYREIQLSSR